MGIKHAFTNLVADETATSRVRPSDWNSAHVQSLAISGNTVGASSWSGTDLVLAGGPGVTLSLAGDTLVINGGAGGGIGLSAGTTSMSAGTAVFSNANGITFGLDASTITASHNGLTSQSNQAFSAAGGSSTFQTLSFVNANGASFSNVGGAVQVSYTVPAVPAQTAQTLGLYGSSQTYGQSSSTTVDARSLTVVGSGGVSVGMSAGSLLVSGQTTAAQTVQTQNLVTVQGSTGAISFANANGISFGGNANTITASHNGLTSQTVQTQSNVQGISAGTQVGRTGDVVFANSNGISWGMSGSSQVTASYTVPSTAGLLSAINVSAGTTSNNLSALTFSNANGVSFGLNGSTITASVAAAGGAQTGVSGISAGTTQLTSGTAVFGNANGISFGVNGQTVTASHNGLTQQSTQPGIQTIAFGNTTFTTGALSFSNANGFSLGSSAGQVTASYTVPSTAGLLSAINVSAGTTSNALSALTFANGNGVTFGLNASTLTASVAAAVAQTNQTLGIYASSNTTGQSSSSTFDARTLSFRGAGVASVGMSAGEVIISVPTGGGGADGINALVVNAGGSTATTTLTLSNGNNVSFGLAAGVITASASFAQSNQTLGGYALGNTTGQSSSSTFDARTMSFNAAGIVSMGWSAGSMYVSATQSGQAVSGQNGSSTFQTLSFANLNGISFGTAAGGITASHNALTTAAASDHSHGNPTLALTNISGTTASNSAGLTLSLSAAAPGGGGGATNSFWVPGAQWGQMSSSVIAGNGSVHIYPAQLNQDLSATQGQHFISVSLSSSSNSSHAGNISLYIGLYTRNGSTLSLASSGSQSYQWSNTSNNSLSVVTGLRRLSVPITVNATPGDYWVALMSRTSTTNANWFTASNHRHNYHVQQLNGNIGETQNNTRGIMNGWGLYSTTTTALPGSIAFTQITGHGSAAGATLFPPAIQFVNFTQ